METLVPWLCDGPSVNRNQFQRVFLSFGPSNEGFQSCWPVISIDGTYGKYKRMMLVDVGVDANNQLFPLAFSIMEVRTTTGGVGSWHIYAPTPKSA